MKQKIGFLLICTLILTMLAPLASMAENDPLWDIKPGIWYYKSVQEMFARGLVQGVAENGVVSFKPDNAVKQTEALVMVIRYLGLEDAANSIAEDEIVRRFNQLGIENAKVEKWARPYIAQGISLGYVKTKNDALGTPATRAWIATLLVRVVQKEAQALNSTNMNKATGFFDDPSIPSSARGYINTAIDLKLMNGISDNGITSFQPNGITSRAQMATLLKRLDENLSIPSNQSIEVVIKEIGANTITYQNKDGKLESKAFTNPIVFIGNEKRTVYNLAALDKVKLMLRGDQIVFIDWMGKGEIIENLVTGTIEDINKDQKLLIIKTQKEGKESMETFFYTDALQIIDENGQKLGFEVLKTGIEVEVRFDPKKIAQEIKVKIGSKEPVVTGDTIDGEFLYVNELDKRITIKLDNGQPQTYQYDENTILIYNKVRFASIKDIHEGDRIRLTLNNNVQQIEVLEVKADQEANKVVGSVVGISDKEAVLTVKVDSQLKAFSVSPKVVIVLNGVPNPALTDLKIGDQVTLELQEDQVIKIEVGDRTNISEVKGRLVSVDSANSLLNYKADNGELMVKELDSKVKVIYEGNQGTLNNLSKNMLLKMTVEDNKITQIEVDNIRKGTIKSIDTVLRKMVMTNAEGLDITYSVTTYALIDVFGINLGKITDLKVGQEVQIYLTVDDEVKRAVVTTKSTTYVYTVNTSTKQLQTIKDGVVTYIPYTDKVVLSIPGKDAPKWEDLKGQTIEITYFGKELVKIEKK